MTIQGDSKRIDQNHHAIIQKRKTTENSNLDTCVVYTFKFLFYVFISAQCALQQQRGQHQADRRIRPRRALGCRGPPS